MMTFRPSVTDIMTMGVYMRKSWSRAFLSHVRRKRREEYRKQQEEFPDVPF